jgi:hypothetical protein
MATLNIRRIPSGRFAGVVSVMGSAFASTLPRSDRNDAARAASALLLAIRANGPNDMRPINPQPRHDLKGSLAIWASGPGIDA